MAATRARDLADRLIAAFGSVAAITAAAPAQLLSITGENIAALITAHRHAMLFALRERAVRRPLLTTRYQLIAYLHHAMAYDIHESLRVFFLNLRRELIAEEVLAQGGVDGIAVQPRQIIVRALEVGATGLILVHNHPSGDPAPSHADRRFTRQLALAGDCLGIRLHDHLVIARDGVERIVPLASPEKD